MSPFALCCAGIRPALPSPIHEMLLLPTPTLPTSHQHPTIPKLHWGSCSKMQEDSG